MSSEKIYRFSNFELDSASGELRRGGLRQHVQGKPLQLLELLLERAPLVVSREQMRRRLWPADTFVDFDRNLNAAVKKVREALDDSAETPRFVETLPRRGYRFIAPVERERPVAVALPVVAAEFTGSSRAVRRALLLIVVLAAALTTSFHPAPTRSATAECPERNMLAVLPFRELPGLQRAGWSDGLGETLAIRLASLSPERLGVVSRRSVEKYRGSTLSVAEIGAELGVTFVVDGSVQRQGNRLLVTVEFVDTGDQTHIWSRAFDLPAGEPAAAQEALVGKLLEAVAGCLLPRPEERVVAAHRPGAAQQP